MCGLTEVDKREKPPFNGFLTIEFLFTINFTIQPHRSIRTALGCAHMATSSPEVTTIGVAQATGTVAAAAVLVCVVSLYCGAAYLDLSFETSTSKVVLGIDFETEMRDCFQAFHPNARVLNIKIGLHNVVGVIRAIRELVPPGARLHLNACLPCNHSSGTSGSVPRRGLVRHRAAAGPFVRADVVL